MLKDLDWLDDASITYIYREAGEDLPTVFFRKNNSNNYQKLTKDEFLPYIWLSKDGRRFDKLEHKANSSAISWLVKKNPNNYFLLKPDSQFLNQRNLNYFENMTFTDFKSITFDIETEGLDPEDNAILAIGIKANFLLPNGKNSYVIDAKTAGERSLLVEFKKIIMETDPDLLIGHNVFSFDFPFIFKRMEKHGVSNSIGRFDSPITTDFRTTKVNRMIPGFDFFQFKIPGRYIIDTLHLAMLEDVRKNEFESYKLKYLAKHLDVAPPDREYIEGDKIKYFYENDFEKFSKYLEDDLTETTALAKIWLPAYIQMSKFVPVDLQTQIYLGVTQKFQALFARDYYHARKVIPKAQPKERYLGGLSEAVNSGIYLNIAKYDVASLYPSIQLTYDIFPKSDTLGSMKKYLTLFKTERLKYKDLANKEKKLIEEGKGSQILYEEYDAYQLALKIFINSFYGVLGNEYFVWNDYKAAGDITGHGRRILTIMMDEIKKSGSTLISVDTDGAYFSYPDTVNPNELVKHINSVLDEGIIVEFEKSWPKMISYKGKNYAMIDSNGKLTKAGSVFKNRSLQPFLIKFKESFLFNALNNTIDLYEDDYYLLTRSIADRTLNIEELIKNTKIKFDWNHYINRESGGKIAHFEAMEAENKTDKYKAGDTVSFYYHGEKLMKTKTEMVKLYDESHIKNDYNIDYYIDVLNKWHTIFKSIIEREPVDVDEILV